MDRERQDVLKAKLKEIRLEADRILIRNCIDSGEDGFLSVFQDERSMAVDGDMVKMKKGCVLSPYFYDKNRDLNFLIITQTSHKDSLANLRNYLP